MTNPRPTGPYLPVVRDYGETQNGTILTRVYRSKSGKSVRVRIKRDFYQHQSYANVSLLTDNGSWTELIGFSPSTWQDNTKSADDFDRLALRLLDAGYAILGEKD